MFVGKVIAMSIVNGGPGPTFLSPVIGGVSAVKPSVEDILDHEIQTKISKVWVVALLKNSTLFSLMMVTVFGLTVV